MRIIVLIAICLALGMPSFASLLFPAIANPGFEEVNPGNDAPGWGWYARARAGFHSETANPHSGKRCMVFYDESDLAPEVYARLYTTVGVLPGVEYELSVWVRGEDVASGHHFTDWGNYTLNIPAGTYDWQKITTTFRTGSGQYALNIGINVVNLCKVLAIDDISLRAVGTPLKGAGINGGFLAPGQVIGDDAKADLAIYVDSKSAGTAKAVITAGADKLFDKSGAIKPGENTLEWEWDSGKTAARELDLTIRVLDSEGKEIASGTQKIEKLGSSISVDIANVEARLKEFDALYARCKAKGIPLDYPTVTRTMLDQMIPYAKEDLQKGEMVRADYASKDFARSMDNAIAEMQAYLRDPKVAPNARRYQTGKVAIDGVSFIGDRKDDKGTKSRGPVFFCGYGHFGQVREDMPKWPGYGVNIIQIEVGPSITMPYEDKIDLTAAKDIVKVLDEAAKKNVMVNVLLSPHYFPAWAFQKWPQLGSGGGGFLGFCVDAPEAKQVIEKFLRTVVPMFKDKRALNSFCLSNEPLFDRTANCPNTKMMWIAYLERIHGDLQTMNQRYGTDYASFEDVPIPANDAYDAPQFYDYCVFNQERFANWHQWMADIIHETAPNVPVHAKVMAWTFLARNTVAWGTNPESFAGFSQINGNDCIMWPGTWQGQNMAYDMQRSIGGKPIFNSENHLIMDRSTSYVPPEHIRTALWQGSIHGQGANTIWVWERTFEHNSDFAGSIMHRPGCAEAVGRTCLDLNRFAEEVTALETATAPVAIVFSIASLARNPRYSDAVGRVYTALNFCGIKIDFISEKQLAAGLGSKYKVIFLPETTHLPKDAYQALSTLPKTTQMRVIGIPPSSDPYGNSLGTPGNVMSYPGDADAMTVLWPAFQSLLAEVGGLPDVSVVGKGGKPVWGVEWLPVNVGGRTVINMVNLLNKPVRVSVLSQGKTVVARDLLSLGSPEVGMLEPWTPTLVEVSK